MGLLAYLLCSAGLLTIREVPAGTRLEIRLTSTVGSYASKAGSPVSAVLIAPVRVGGELLLPSGSVLTGTVKSVRRIGYGIMHETAAMALLFDKITLPDDETLPIDARVIAVDNGRERVEKNGEIGGMRMTSSLAYRASGYIRMALMTDVHAQLAVWAIKTLVIQVPEPEIYFTPGVELSLTLTEPVPARAQREPEDAPRHLAESERDALDALLAGMPTRTTDPTTHRPSDLINLIMVGSREQIAAAFRAAGWTEAASVTMRSRIQGVRAVVEGRSSQTFPMTKLLLNDVRADMSWQKSLNDLSKRHHVRIWKQPGTWQGQEIWIAAATRDIDFAFMHQGAVMTHRIESNIDLERDKIVNDLVFTSYVDMLDWQERSSIPTMARNGKGDLMSTDTKIALLRFRNCDRPRLYTDSDEFDTPPIHGKVVQRFIRREILSARSDLVRNNMYWRGYEGVRWVVTAIRSRNHPPEVADALPNPSITRFVSLR
ncbi:MAG TPA: LssY C-terminal domain-containing protein [Bryobacteraceae bacterium]|nr:LssY C-terminal domain-containing protein [Bryobacteraceae bacterium]